MVRSLHTLLHRYLSAFCIVLYAFLPSCRARINILPTERTLYNATDPMIQWTPSLDDSDTWSPISADGFSGVETTNSTATASFTLQGADATLITLDQPNFYSVLVTVDTRQLRVNLSDDHFQRGVKMTPIPIDNTGVSLPKNRSIVIQEDTSPGMNNNGWNLLGISIAPAFVVSTSTQPITTLPAIPQESVTSPTQEQSTTPSVQVQSNGLSAGGKAGVVIGTLSGVSLVGLLFVCLRRRQRQMAEVAPEPLVITPVAPPRRDRSRFQRIYSERLPHFTAPSSIWPTSNPRASTWIDSPNPAIRQVQREKLTPLPLPAIAPQVLAPSPPRHSQSRRNRLSQFFVANPSSHSSRSARSLSFKNLRILPERVISEKADPALVKPTPWTPYVGEKRSPEMQEVRRAERGKKGAVDFEIDPAPPRASRKRSLRRFFFTTNPNPSTSSSSSASSSQRIRNWKRKAVADHVRNQMQQTPAAPQLLDSVTYPLTAPTPPRLPPDTIHEELEPSTMKL
ncbi:uncharacterized protein FOMMEDRAFT_165203, partial [Fomitiporia mediterranea MF3/22]|uniref:uncharacterized protein n=1 Tax=Fomitiporia mediterranea (strain MF3/22) TaxID=694068 RepID=UPI000440954A